MGRQRILFFFFFRRFLKLLGHFVMSVYVYIDQISKLVIMLFSMLKFRILWIKSQACLMHVYLMVTKNEIRIFVIILANLWGLYVELLQTYTKMNIRDFESIDFLKYQINASSLHEFGTPIYYKVYLTSRMRVKDYQPMEIKQVKSKNTRIIMLHFHLIW